MDGRLFSVNMLSGKQGVSRILWKTASLLIREIIKYLSSKTRKFDFEGSMIEPVEQSFRRFGAIQERYFRTSKVNSRLLSLYRALKGF